MFSDCLSCAHDEAGAGSFLLDSAVEELLQVPAFIQHKCSMVDEDDVMCFEPLTLDGVAPTLPDACICDFHRLDELATELSSSNAAAALACCDADESISVMAGPSCVTQRSTVDVQRCESNLSLNSSDCTSNTAVELSGPVSKLASCKDAVFEPAAASMQLLGGKYSCQVGDFSPPASGQEVDSCAPQSGAVVGTNGAAMAVDGALATWEFAPPACCEQTAMICFDACADTSQHDAAGSAAFITDDPDPQAVAVTPIAAEHSSASATQRHSSRHDGRETGTDVADDGVDVCREVSDEKSENLVKVEVRLGAVPDDQGVAEQASDHSATAAVAGGHGSLECSELEEQMSPQKSTAAAPLSPCSPPQSRSPSTPNTPRKAGGPCDHCGVTESPQWRRGPTNKPMLCNACGTRYRRTNQLGPPVPSCRRGPAKKAAKASNKRKHVAFAPDSPVRTPAVPMATTKSKRVRTVKRMLYE